MIEFKLAYPVDYQGGEVEKLEIRRPKVRDLIVADELSSGDQEEFTRKLACNLAMVSEELLDEMDFGEDVTKLAAVLTNLIMNEGRQKADKNQEKSRSVRVDLKYPVQHDGKNYQYISVRRPRYKDIKTVEKENLRDIKRSVRLLSAVCGVPLGVIEELDAGDDYALAKDYLNLFLGVSQP